MSEYIRFLIEHWPEEKRKNVLERIPKYKLIEVLYTLEFLYEKNLVNFKNFEEKKKNYKKEKLANKIEEIAKKYEVDPNTMSGLLMCRLINLGIPIVSPMPTLEELGGIEGIIEKVVYEIGNYIKP